MAKQGQKEGPLFCLPNTTCANRVNEGLISSCKDWGEIREIKWDGYFQFKQFQSDLPCTLQLQDKKETKLQICFICIYSTTCMYGVLFPLWNSWKTKEQSHVTAPPSGKRKKYIWFIYHPFLWVHAQFHGLINSVCGSMEGISNNRESASLNLQILLDLDFSYHCSRCPRHVFCSSALFCQSSYRTFWQDDLYKPALDSFESVLVSFSLHRWLSALSWLTIKNL